MDNLLIVLLAIVIIGCLGKSKHSHGGCNVKPKTNTKRPDIVPGPQSSKRNKQGRTKDEQELHEWMEDNPR